MDNKLKKYRWISSIVFLLSLIPIIIISGCVYPQADDFAFSQRTYHIWNSTHSVLSVFLESIRVSYNYWWEWQGSYTSCFLMALQPGIFGEKIYHIVPFILIGLLWISLFCLNKSILKKLNVSKDIYLIATNIETFVIYENIVDQAEAFFWYNSGIHYMGLLSIELLYYAYIIEIAGKKCSFKKKFILQVGACVLAVIVAGGNNLTVLSALIINISIIVLLTFSRINRKESFFGNLVMWIPSSIMMIIGGTLNILSVGNGVRLEYVGGTKHSVISTILLAFENGFYYSFKWFDYLIVLYCICVVVLGYWVISKKSIKLDTFSIKIPVLVSIYGYCLISAMFAPEIYTFGFVGTRRTLNVIFVFYVLTLGVGIYIWELYFYIKKEKIFNYLCSICVVIKKYRIIVYAIICVVGLATVISNPSRYTTTSAMYYLYKGEAIDCKNVIEYNFELLNNEEISEVVLKKLPSEPSILFSSEIDEWKAGTRLYYDKQSVEWGD